MKKLSALILTAATALSTTAHAKPFSSGLIDFNIGLSAKRNPSQELLVVHVCTKEAVKQLAYVPTGVGKEVVKETIQTALNPTEYNPQVRPSSLPVFKGCVLQSSGNYLYSTYGRTDISLIDMYKVGMSNKINPADMVILVSVAHAFGFSSTMKYIQNTYIDPMSLVVKTAQKAGADVTITPAKDADPAAPVITVTATLEDPLSPLYAKLNTPALLHRESVMKKVLGLTGSAPLTIGNFLSFEVIYFATKNMPEWKTIALTSEAEMQFSGGADIELQNVRGSTAFKKITALNQVQLANMYASIYKANIDDVIALNDANPQQAMVAQSGNSPDANLDKLTAAAQMQAQAAQYQMQRQQAVDFVNAASGLLELAGGAADKYDEIFGH